MYIIAPSEKSWVDVAPGNHFPIQNLPLGLALIEDAEAVVTRIGDWVLNISGLMESSWLPEIGPVQYGELEITTAQASELRRRIAELLHESNAKKSEPIRAKYLLELEDTELLVPMPIGAFVDFYSGINHASNVGKMFRPEAPPLLPNYRHIPVAYNGRASSILVSGSPVPRPHGIYKEGEKVVFGPTHELDFELEVGFFLAAPEMTEDEDIVPVDGPDSAEDRILGFVLVNDWSARDVQRFEYQPLGPFLAKSFATSVSPWIILKDALEPFRVQGPKQEPQPLPHLQAKGPRHYDIALEVGLQSPKMEEIQVISETNYTELYWSPTQQLLHQASNGTLLEPGDLYASGTISGSEKGTYGSLLELTWRGETPIKLEESGEMRTFLEDGDSVTFVGTCHRPGLTLGFGEVEGTIFPSLPR
jgi:fumarylacetoacetase